MIIRMFVALTMCAVTSIIRFTSFIVTSSTATGTHRSHLDPETDPGLRPFSSLVQFSE